MKLKNYNYLILNKTVDNRVSVEVANINNSEDVATLQEFNTKGEAERWVHLNYRGSYVLPLIEFSDIYKEVFHVISKTIDTLVEDNKFALLVVNSGRRIKKLKLLGITVDEEICGDNNTVYAINHHILVQAGDSLFMSHQIIYHQFAQNENNIIEGENKVIPLLQNASYYDSSDEKFVVKKNNSGNNDSIAQYLKELGGLGNKTVEKFCENNKEESELALFLEKVGYSKMIKKHETVLKILKEEYLKYTTH